MKIMLEVEGVTAGYYEDLLVIRNLSLRAEKGTLVAVLGANGVGKSTLLKVLCGLLTPREGRIELEGDSLIGRSPHAMAELGVAYISQTPSVFSHMTVEENLRLGAWTFRRDRQRVQARLHQSFERFPALREKRRQIAHQLSGGQRRMIEIGRALMIEPRLLLVDEPGAGLSSDLASQVYVELGDLRDAGLTIVLVDQDIRRALRIADYVYVVELGTNRFEGTSDLFTDVEKMFWS